MDPRHVALVREVVAASGAAREAFFAAHAQDLAAAAAATAEALRAGGTVLLFGNGGSAADAQHVATELVVRMDRERPPIRALALTVDSSALTAISNDYGFEQVFARQIEALGRPGDVAVAISTSGNSPNVLAGLVAAESAGMLTIGLLGRDGGKCRRHCRFPLVVPSRSTQRVQETHILIGHLFAELVEDLLHPAER